MTVEVFEAALRRKVEGNPRQQVLLDQWGFDKRGIARALATVSQWFPHYSLHDQSHADTVLEQIGRILGPERIERLSATDLWLMLEAAYLHDVGMVVRDDEARAWWGSEECREFLATHRARGGELVSAIERLEGRDLDGEHWSFDVRRALILVMAEYYRSQHAARAEHVVRDPTLLGLVSPRPPEIPERLFAGLGKICAAHGQSLQQTMALPREQNGLTDRAHPRFVACMLRLGDLLDVDSGRFCAVMLQTFGVLPPTSELHRRKHASLQRFNLTPQQVDLEASCDDYGTYEVTSQWFDWLKQELAGQISRWAEIRPADDFGPLPTDHRIDVRLEGLLDLGKKRPRFALDRAAVLELVRGANVYSQPMAFVRELVQNAVDATLIRAFREHGAPKDLGGLREVLAAYPIEVGFARLGPGAPGADGEPTVRWSITVQDQGIGISRAEIDKILEVGSSSRDPERRALIEQMPEWMRPSGAFGIGLQSVAMMAEQLTLDSYPWREGQGYRLRVRFGKDADGDEILAWPLDRKAGPASDGTRAEVVIEIPKVPRHLPIVSGLVRAGQRLVHYDPLVSDELPLDIDRGLDIVHELVDSSLVPVEARYEREPAPRPAPAKSAWGAHFDPEACVEIRAFEPHYGKFLRASYRGAPIDRRRPWLPGAWNDFFCASLDFMFGTARDVLELSRDRARQAAWPQLQRRATLALLGALPRWLEHLDQQEHPYLALASVGAKLLLEEQARPRSSFWHQPLVRERLDALRAVVESRGAWRSANILVDDTLTMGALWSNDELKLQCSPQGGGHWWGLHHQGTWHTTQPWAPHVFAAGWRGLAYVNDRGPTARDYVLTKQEHHRWVVARACILGLLGGLGATPMFAVTRCVIPLVEGFDALEIEGAGGDDEGAAIPLHMQWFHHRLPDIVQRHPMICPFVADPADRITLPELPAVVDATLRFSPTGPARAEVIEALGRFIHAAHEQLAPAWGDRIAYDLPAALAGLERL